MVARIEEAPNPLGRGITQGNGHPILHCSSAGPDAAGARLRPSSRPVHAVSPRPRCPPRHFPYPLALDELGQIDAAQELLDLAAEIRPQVMGEAACVVLAVLLPVAPGGVHVFIDRADDVGDDDGAGFEAQTVPPPRGRACCRPAPACATVRRAAPGTRARCPGVSRCRRGPPGPDRGAGPDRASPSPRNGPWR